MIDFCAMKRRYLPVKLRNGMIINVEEPKVKVIDMIMSIQKAYMDKKDINEDDIKKEDIEDLNSLYQNVSIVTSMCLSKNKEKRKYGVEWVKENMTMDEMSTLITGVIEWSNNAKPKN